VTLGLVSGSVASGHKDTALKGLTLLAVQELDLTLTPTGAGIIVADAVGAGPGDVVLIAHGVAAMLCDAAAGKPIDAAAIAIVERIDLV